MRSQFADDDDFREVLEAFVQALPDRGRQLAQVHRDGSLEELGRCVHQLKGAGGGYGFPDVSAAAAELEQACRAGDAARAGQSLAGLLDLLARVEA